MCIRDRFKLNRSYGGSGTNTNVVYDGNDSSSPTVLAEKTASGTYDYINNLEEFTINAGLIINRKPVAGLINAPAKKRMFYAFAKGSSFELTNGKLTKLDCSKKTDKNTVKVVSYSNKLKPEIEKIDVSDADIIVSGGRGLQSADKFNIIENLAEVLGAATGASRAVVYEGWRKYSEQVRQTG